MSPRQIRKYPGMVAALLTVFLSVAWLIFAPVNLGGQSSYVIINGDSMEPLYRQGDLVILRQSDTTEVGDIFAYQYPELGPVIHRIVGREGERYIFKGDHNSWIDGYKPTVDDFIGKANFHLVGAGNTVRWLRNPIRFTGLVAIMAGLIVFGVVIDSSKKKVQKMKIKWPLFNFKYPQLPPSMARDREGYLFVLFLLLFASVALGIYAYISPISKTVEDNLDYLNSADFSYAIYSNPKVYDEGLVVSGDPVFTQLNCVLKVKMEYAIQSTSPVNISGSYNARVVVSEPTGWNREIRLLPDTPFQDNGFEMSAVMNVCAIKRMIEAANELAGLNRPYYSVSVISDISSNGTIGDRNYEDKLAPQMNFSFDTNELYLNQSDASGSDPLHWEQPGMILGVKKTANELSIFGLKIPVLTARIIAVVGIIISVAGILWLVLPAYQDAKKDELAAIHLKYAPQLVKISQSKAKRRTASTKLIDVTTIEDLARIAQSADQFILEEKVGDENHFLVIADPFTYRYIHISPTNEVKTPEPEGYKDIKASEEASSENAGDSE